MCALFSRTVTCALHFTVCALRSIFTAALLDTRPAGDKPAPGQSPRDWLAQVGIKHDNDDTGDDDDDDDDDDGHHDDHHEGDGAEGDSVVRGGGGRRVSSAGGSRRASEEPTTAVGWLRQQASGVWFTASAHTVHAPSTACVHSSHCELCTVVQVHSKSERRVTRVVAARRGLALFDRLAPPLVGRCGASAHTEPALSCPLHSCALVSM
jgi:hypothetical protein